MLYQASSPVASEVVKAESRGMDGGEPRTLGKRNLVTPTEGNRCRTVVPLQQLEEKIRTRQPFPNSEPSFQTSLKTH